MIYLVFNPRQPLCQKNTFSSLTQKKKNIIRKENSEKSMISPFSVIFRLIFFGVLYPTLSELINHWLEISGVCLIKCFKVFGIQNPPSCLHRPGHLFDEKIEAFCHVISSSISLASMKSVLEDIRCVPYRAFGYQKR